MKLATCFHAGFLLSLFFDPEDRGDMFLKTSVHFQRTTCFHAGFLLSLFFDPEDRGNMFLQNIGRPSVEYMAA
jgi:hypothetical protein